MKRIYYLTLLLPLFLISCESTPEAAFYVDNIEPEVGQEVLFTNNSDNAERFEWDFGDNTWTDEPSPIHVYTGTGTYQVKLSAFSKSGLVSTAFATIDVMIPTLLEVEVLE
jgi:PKD repeat protein